MIRDDTIHVRCVDISYEGKGVCKSGNDVYFVPSMFPGEEGDIVLSYTRNGAKFGKLVHLDAVSPDRVEPMCKICSSCGGCQFQQYAYGKQLEWKAKNVKEQFRKIAKMDVAVNPCIGMDEPYFYRNKIQMPIGKDKKGQIISGFFKSGTHDIVPVGTCYIEDRRSEGILQSIKGLMKSMRIDPYDEDKRTGIVRHILIRTSFYRKEVMVVLVTSVDSFPGRGNLIKALVKSNPEITTIVQNINSRQTNVILGEKERILYGPGFIRDSLCGIEFKISAKSFYQTNPLMTEKLYEYAIKAGKIDGNCIVFDAYSGIGTIGLIASKKAREVLSVELVKEAVSDGRRNAERNGITNFRMFCDDASTFMMNMASEGRKVDVLFMDPPRKGSDERFLEAVLKLRPSRVVYVSCDPSTLARDIKILAPSYRIESVQPFDMFPHTAHVETVCLMSRVEGK